MTKTHQLIMLRVSKYKKIKNEDIQVKTGHKWSAKEGLKHSKVKIMASGQCGTASHLLSRTRVHNQTKQEIVRHKREKNIDLIRYQEDGEAKAGQGNDTQPAGTVAKLGRSQSEGNHL